MGYASKREKDGSRGDKKEEKEGSHTNGEKRCALETTREICPVMNHDGIDYIYMDAGNIEISDVGDL